MSNGKDPLGILKKKQPDFQELPDDPLGILTVKKKEPTPLEPSVGQLPSPVTEPEPEPPKLTLNQRLELMTLGQPIAQMGAALVGSLIEGGKSAVQMAKTIPPAQRGMSAIATYRGAQDLLDEMEDKPGNEIVGSGPEAMTVDEARTMLQFEQKKAAKKGVDALTEGLERFAELGGDPSVTKDIRQIKGPTDFIEFVGHSIGQAVPQMAFALGTLGTGSYFLESSMMFMDAIDRLAREQNKTPRQIIEEQMADPQESQLFGLAAGALDFLSLGMIAKATGANQVAKQLFKRGLAKQAAKKAVAKEAGKAAGTEFLTESAQGVLAEVGAARTIEGEIRIDPLGILSEGLSGAIAGGFLGGTGRSFTNIMTERRIRYAKANQQLLEKAQAAEPTAPALPVEAEAQPVVPTEIAPEPEAAVPVVEEEVAPTVEPEPVAVPEEPARIKEAPPPTELKPAPVKDKAGFTYPDETTPPTKWENPQWTVTVENGQAIPKHKQGREVTKRRKNQIIQEYRQKYPYQQGSTSFENAPEGTTPGPQSIAEYSKNPSEIAESYVEEKRQQEEAPVANLTEMYLTDMLGKVRLSDFERAGDRNLLNKEINKEWIVDDSPEAIQSGKTSREEVEATVPTDTQAKQMSDMAGIEIGEQDIIDFIVNNAEGVQPIAETEAQKSLNSKFQDLTGLPINIETATLAAEAQENAGQEQQLTTAVPEAPPVTEREEFDGLVRTRVQGIPEGRQYPGRPTPYPAPEVPVKPERAEIPETEARAARQEFDTALKDLKDFLRDEQKLGIAADPRQQAERDYQFYQKVFAVAKAAAKLGIASAKDLAARIGQKLNPIIQQAWDDAQKLDKPLNQKDYASKISRPEEEVRRKEGRKDLLRDKEARRAEPAPREEKKEKPKVVIYNNDAILTGKQRKSKANITPELAEEDIAYDAVNNQLAQDEAQRIIDQYGVDAAEKAANDISNDMADILRRITLLEVAKVRKRQGDQAGAARAFRSYKNLGKEAARGVQVGNVARNDPEIKTIELIERVNEINETARQEKLPNGKTVGETVDTAINQVQQLSTNTAQNITKTKEFQDAVEREVQKRWSQVKGPLKRKGASNKGDRVRGRNRISRALEEYRKSQGSTLNASIFGITPEHTQLASQIALGYIEIGVQSLQSLINQTRKELSNFFNQKIDLHSNAKEQISSDYFRDLLAKGEIDKAAQEYVKSQSQLIAETVTKHYSQRDAEQNKLATKLASLGSLSPQQSQSLARSVKREFNKKAEEKAKQITARLSRPKKKTVTPRQAKSRTDKIIEAINLGAFDQEFVKQELGEKLGLSGITDDFIAEAEELVGEMSRLEQEENQTRALLSDKLGGDVRLENSLNRMSERHRRAQQKFLNFIKKAKHPVLGDRIIDVIMDVYYTNMLSGLSTLARATKGASLTSVLTMFTWLNTPGAFLGALNAARKGVAGTSGIWMDVLKTGYTDLEFLGQRVTSQGFTARLANTTFNQIRTNPKIGRPQKIWMSFLKGVLAPPVYMYRALIANDAVMKYGLVEGEAYIIEYNHILDQLNGTKNASFYNQLNHQLALDKGTQKIVSEIVDNEIGKMDQVPSGYRKRRIQELTDAMRDAETVMDANNKAKEAVLMSEPKGTLGALYKWASQFGIVQEQDKGPIVVLKFMFKSIFPFLRVPTNFLNMAIDYSPLGLIRPIRGKRTLEARPMTPEENRRHYFKAATGMAVFTSLFAEMFEWDDDEEKFVLDPDSFIEVTAEGSGNYFENLNRDPDFKKYSFKIKMFGQTFGPFSYVDNPLGLWLAPLGAASDAVKYQDFKKKAQRKDTTKRDVWDNIGAAGMAMWFFASSQSYSQGINQIMGLFKDQTQAGGGNAFAKALAKRITAPATSTLQPNLYKQIYGIGRSLADVPEHAYYSPSSTPETIYRKAAKDFMLTEGLLANHDYDMLGHPIIRRRELGLIPDMLMRQVAENIDYREGIKEWQLIYKYDEVGLGRPYQPPNELELNAAELSEYQKMAGLKLRSIIKTNYATFNNLDAVKLQIALNRAKSGAQSFATGEFKKRKNIR